MLSPVAELVEEAHQHTLGRLALFKPASTLVIGKEKRLRPCQLAGRPSEFGRASGKCVPAEVGRQAAQVGRQAPP